VRRVLIVCESNFSRETKLNYCVTNCKITHENILNFTRVIMTRDGIMSQTCDDAPNEFSAWSKAHRCSVDIALSQMLLSEKLIIYPALARHSNFSPNSKGQYALFFFPSLLLRMAHPS
jgi:hypothetical protein